MTRPLLLVVGLVAAVYLPAAACGFVWDDHSLVEANQVLAHPTWETVFARDLWFGTGGYASPYFRPALTVSLLADRWIFGGSAAAAHLQNVVWHLVATVLVAIGVRRHAGNDAGVIAAAIFGLHPIQSEAVVWVSARNDLLVAVWALGAILAAERGRVVVAAACAALAGLSKESGILVPLLALTWGYAWGRRLPRPALFALFVGVALAATLRNLATLGTPFHPFPFGPDNALAWIWAALEYLSWFVWPWPLTSTATLFGPVPSLPVFLGAAAALALAFVAVRVAPRRSGLLLLFAAVALAPSAVGTTYFYSLGERYLYLPMVGVAAAAASFLAAARVPRAALLGTAGACVATLTIRLPEWKDDVSFFTAAGARRPDAYTLALEGKALLDAGRPVDALAALEGSLRARPARPFACRYVATAGRSVLTWPQLRARYPEWVAGNCRSVAGFSDTMVTAAAVNQDWDLAAAWLEDQFAYDRTGRNFRVRAAMAARAGDLLGFAALCLYDGDKEGAGPSRASVLPLLQLPYLAPSPSAALPPPPVAPDPPPL